MKGLREERARLAAAAGPPRTQHALLLPPGRRFCLHAARYGQREDCSMHTAASHFSESAFVPFGVQAHCFHINGDSVASARGVITVRRQHALARRRPARRTFRVAAAAAAVTADCAPPYLACAALLTRAALHSALVRSKQCATTTAAPFEPAGCSSVGVAAARLRLAESGAGACQPGCANSCAASGSSTRGAEGAGTGWGAVDVVAAGCVTGGGDVGASSSSDEP